MSLITIDQLLESVDLDFEPRFVTKNRNGGIYVWATRPHYRSGVWFGDESVDSYIAKLKLAEFEGKSSDECIYEVPRKTTGRIEKLPVNVDWVDPKDQTVVLSNECIIKMYAKITALVDAVNELKAKFELPTLNPDLTDEDLRKMMRAPKYWRDKDSATIQKVQNGFNKLYGDKN